MKPKIFTLHHLSAFGGTIVTKLASTSDNLFVVNEVHPHVVIFNTRQISPTVIAEQFMLHYNKLSKDFLDRLFSMEVALILEEISKDQGHLLLRDWSHGDYLSENAPLKCTLLPLLQNRFPEYDIHSLATLRDPIDSYVSVTDSGFLKGINDSFDEYCRRYTVFVKDYDRRGVSFMKYEDIILEPTKLFDWFRQLAKIEFPEDYQNRLDRFAFSGSSGRSSTNLALRSKRKLPKELLGTIGNSEPYRALLRTLENMNIEYAPPTDH